MLEPALQIITTIAALVIVLLLAWVTLRWMSKRMPGLSGGSGRMINVLDRVTVGKNASILLIRVQDKVILVAASEHAFEKLYEFDDPDGTVSSVQDMESVKFSSVLKDAASKFSTHRKNEEDKP